MQTDDFLNLWKLVKLDPNASMPSVGSRGVQRAGRINMAAEEIELVLGSWYDRTFINLSRFDTYMNQHLVGHKSTHEHVSPTSQSVCPRISPAKRSALCPVSSSSSPSTNDF